VGAVLDRVLCQAHVRLLEAGAARGQLVQQQPVSEGDLADVLAQPLVLPAVEEGVKLTAEAGIGELREKSIAQCEEMGLGNTPVCMAKTQYSFSDDPTKLGRPSGFQIHVPKPVEPAELAAVVASLASSCGSSKSSLRKRIM
jgi:CheY-like chemotaxis protein